MERWSKYEKIPLGLLVIVDDSKAISVVSDVDLVL